MRYVRSCAAFAGLVLLTSTVQAQLPNRVPPILMEALEKGKQFELYSLDPAAKDTSKEGFADLKVLGKTSVKDDETRKKLIEALSKGAQDNQGINPTKEFPPRQGIRVVYEGKTYDFALNFDSFKTEFYIDGKRQGGFRVTKSPQSVFEKVLKDAKVQTAEAPKPEEKKEPVRLADAPLPGFPNILYNGTLVEVPGRDDKPLLKIIKADYDKDKKVIVWLVELQTDIEYDSFLNIHKAWQNDEGTLSKGPAAFFFDKDRVQLYMHDLKEQGQLRNGKKGDRIRLLLDVGDGFPDATYMEIRRPLPATAGYGH
jgi:hypothetical protein